MMCSMIRDLLPLYEEKLCSKETIEFVEEHLKECAECRGLFDEMHSDIGLKEVANKISTSTDELSRKNHDKSDIEFWRKYYGSLLVKGVGIFLITYIVIVSVWMNF